MAQEHVRPFCFMVMPFGKKKTQAESDKAPAEIDFNALWDKAYFPLLKELGYEPVRADQETGSLIINQMLERLYFSDLVVADMTIPNGNVYYEVGLRHAAVKDGCVLVAADWSKALFDVAQMRSVRYPLATGDIDEAAAKAIQDALRPQIPRMREGMSPFFEALPGYPRNVDAHQRAGVKDQTQMLAAFEAQMRAARAMPQSLKLTQAREYAKRHEGRAVPASVGLGLLRLLVSAVKTKDEWQEVLTYVSRLSEKVADDPYAIETEALALGKVGRPVDAIAKLNTVIERLGDSSERQGLIGGRYKELMRAAKDKPQECAYYRNRAIEHYENGMMLDLNDYFPSSNLPRLYRSRGEPGDESRAQLALQVTIAACDRAVRRKTSDEWVRPTLLSAAFDLPDAEKAEALAAEVQREGAGAWQLATTLESIRESVTHVRDDGVRQRLEAVYARLAAMQ
jgi:hypothetical protein